ncbi:MAG TPA: hypothetical protein DCE41_37865 [Cytophagales bacterium]|nr:hypothetical protein [Cytophagales bacterium]HAA18708.1 hypothetical protein [Cytophagales bacterium]HAP61563.1 hypothetical protein [Cytophagales bacterium]
MQKAILIFVLAMVSANSWGQSSLIPLNEDLYHQIDRLVISQPHGKYGFQGVARPYSRSQVAELIRGASPQSTSLKRNRDFLAQQLWDNLDTLVEVDRAPIAKYFFRKKTDFYSVNTDHFKLRVNSVVHLGAGLSPGDTARMFHNTRGVEVMGDIDGKVSFYTIMADNQARWAPYVRNTIDSMLIIPGQGFWKPFRTSGVDYFLARGHIAVPVSKHITLSGGHDRQFIGHGYRSMIWSDFSPPHLFFRADTRVWKVRYTNLFTQMVADINTTPGGTLGGLPFSNKQVVFHHLTVNLTPNFQGSVFELVVNGDADSLGSRFGLNYLNPIIFYRALEQQGGSSGNVLLGADFKWDLWKRLRIYGQFILDEFLFSELQAQRGWWGNKYGAQLGMKYVDAFGVPGMDLQLEANWARPYTYTHLSTFTAATHYWQPIAHPLGANFQEGIAIIRYQPHPKWQLIAKGIGAIYGTDTTGSNWGTNLLLNYDTRERQFDNEIGQGVRTLWGMGEFRVNYMIWHQCFLEFRGMARYLQKGNQEPDLQYNAWLQLRWSIPYRPQDY